jgi:hypothetical protein
VKITELNEREVEFLSQVFQRALENGQTVKVCIDGGLKVKRGESMWTPPLGHDLKN